jgi:hypothetical protein
VLADCLVRDPTTGELTAGAFTAALGERLGVEFPAPIFAAVDVTRVQGHVGAWNMGRGTATAVAAGSVYAFETRRPDLAPGTVVTLGDRTHEGYGRVVINMQGGMSDAVVRRLEDFPVPVESHDAAGTKHDQEAWAWLSRRIADTWYAERSPLIATLVRIEARPAPGALSALRVAVARGQFPGALPDDPLKTLERCGLGKKNLESLRRGRVEGESLLSTISGILQDEDGAALRALFARLESRDPEAKRPQWLAKWLSRETGRRFVDTLLERMRRDNPDNGRRGEV